jgi:hypothetical protein
VTVTHSKISIQEDPCIYKESKPRLSRTRTDGLGLGGSDEGLIAGKVFASIRLSHCHYWLFRASSRIKLTHVRIPFIVNPFKLSIRFILGLLDECLSRCPRAWRTWFLHAPNGGHNIR